MKTWYLCIFDKDMLDSRYVSVIGRYYSLDAEVARELVGRGQKMTAKLRKDLDTISDKTGVPLKSCLRQYDNIKRIYKVNLIMM